MSMFSAEIRRKPEWWTSFQDQRIRLEWDNAAFERLWKVRTPSSVTEVQLSQEQIHYVLDELAGYAALRDEANRCQVSCFERIWESDSLFDSTTTNQLNEQLAALREELSMSEDSEDRNSISLIDPLLYCLVYGRTLVSTTVANRPPRTLSSPTATDIYTVCPQFTLIPTDVYITPNGSPAKRANLLSYINNLDPATHRDMYNILETCLSGFIPLFEHVLTDLHRNNPLSQRIPGRCRYTEWDEPEPPEHSDDEEGWTTYEREMRHWVMNRPIEIPDIPRTGYHGGLERRKHLVSLRGKKIQVIVELSEVRLTPENPVLPDTLWQVEGMRNERIIACGFCFASVDNMSPSIEFRMAVTSPRGFNAGDAGATVRTWGFQDGDSCHQYIGHVPIKAGLNIAFPNIYQHRQTKIALLNPSEVGHLTLLAFFIVDPEVDPIPSTSSIAPQQKSWIKDILSATLQSRLPMELIEKILEETEGLMDRNEARTYRNELLNIRAGFRQANNNYHFCIPFDIWNGPGIAH
ncbi:hypothetical protein BDQ17DRAFT_1345457 [Cyathus striatus]|nr:hypothetical protein BDQ17DRAFT_1345457 [Cyathus striatus]